MDKKTVDKVKKLIEYHLEWLPAKEGASDDWRGGCYEMAYRILESLDDEICLKK